MAFSIDVEEWFHGIELTVSEWEGKASRLERGPPQRTKPAFIIENLYLEARSGKRTSYVGRATSS